MKKPSLDREEENENYTLSNCSFMELGDNVRRMHEAKKKWNQEPKEEVSFV